jgi:hypothetical protein
MFDAISPIAMPDERMIKQGGKYCQVGYAQDTPFGGVASG